MLHLVHRHNMCSAIWSTGPGPDNPDCTHMRIITAELMNIVTDICTTITVCQASRGHKRSVRACSVPNRTRGVNVLHGNWLASDHSLLLHVFNAGTLLRCFNHAATAYTFTIVYFVH